MQDGTVGAMPVLALSNSKGEVEQAEVPEIMRSLQEEVVRSLQESGQNHPKPLRRRTFCCFAN